MVWTRITKQETGEITGWFEDDKGNVLTLTKGIGHLVFGGKALAFQISEEEYSSNVNTIAKKVISHLPKNERLEGD